MARASLGVVAVVDADGGNAGMNRAEQGKSETVFIGMGGNLGDPATQIQQAARRLHQTPGVVLAALSGLYANPPMGPQDQPDYVNAVACVHTRLSPVALLTLLKELERKAGRMITRRWGERVLDLDILSFGQLRMQTDLLTVPHPGIEARRFVVEPWLEIAPDTRLPDGSYLADIANQLTDHPLELLERPDMHAITAPDVAGSVKMSSAGGMV